MIITAGIYKGRKVIAPDEKIARPTLSKIRESIFNILFSMLDFEGKSFFDMFAGSGIMGLEALSRGFEYVLASEKNPKAIKILKENYANINIKENLISGNSLKHKINKKFDIIYIDPPYFSGIYEKSLEKIQKDFLLNDNGIIILEHVNDISWNNFKLIKQKKYSDKFISFLMSK
jgi:16S rRNA (guanine966-N2)-methyltransferase